MVKTEVTHNTRHDKIILPTLNTHPLLYPDTKKQIIYRITMKCLRGSSVSSQLQQRTEAPFDLSDRAHRCYLDGLIFRILEH